MRTLASVIIFCTLASFSKADYCEENFTLAEFPEGLRKEVISLLLFGTVENFVGCPENVTVPSSDVKLWFFSRNNPTVPILLDPTNPTQLDTSKRIIILAPGWLCNITNAGMPELKDAYLQRYDANIIAVDWTAQSIQLYTQSYCAIPLVARIIGEFLCFIHSNLNGDLSEVHMVGHSMGGQMSGFIGQEVQLQCKQKLGRITALDPAGPLYQDNKPDRRLDKSDATFVDVIHTNMAFLGFYGTCGAVDFYPNCGTFQPGCIKIDGDTSISDIINFPVKIVACNHIRAIDYFRESINSNSFTSRSCRLCPGLPIIGPCMPDLIKPSKVQMGEDCPPNPEDKKYRLSTNNKPPFGKG